MGSSFIWTHGGKSSPKGFAHTCHMICSSRVRSDRTLKDFPELGLAFLPSCGCYQDKYSPLLYNWSRASEHCRCLAGLEEGCWWSIIGYMLFTRQSHPRGNARCTLYLTENVTLSWESWCKTMVAEVPQHAMAKDGTVLHATAPAPSVQFGLAGNQARLIYS